jgi:DNA repair exonuclease SbcCD ATPase subunit
MSKASKSSANKKPTVNAKELQLKVDELTEALENVRNENERLRTKLSTICKKIVSNVDMTQYEFIDPHMEPDLIETNDLLHMIQKLALLAAQINTTEKIESHMEALERRITELVSENSTFFKNKLKLQERLEFIMQERDIWKRNAETLKKMYAKLGNFFYVK